MALYKYCILLLLLSLGSSLFPEDFQCAHVNQIRKKTTLSKEELDSYRPISNLNFISKILEKVVANRLSSHININGLTHHSPRINSFTQQKLLF